MHVKPMHVKFERSGGFAGLRLALDLDAGDLTPGERAQLGAWLRDADFFGLPPDLRALVRWLSERAAAKRKDSPH